MIQVELDGFTIQVPIRQHMSASEFLAVADKLEQLAGAQTRRPMTPLSPRFSLPPMQGKGDVDHLIKELRVLEKTIEHHDAALRQIIEYLYSVERSI